MVLESLATNYIGWPTSRFVYVYKGTTFFVRFQISGIDLGRFLARNRSIDVFNIGQPLNEPSFRDLRVLYELSSTG